ncbi:MAG: hypothetical protein ABL879_13700 [Devosia sp.]
MNVKSWVALVYREYIEHRIAFLYFPLGILVLLILAAAAAIGFNPPNLPAGLPMPPTSKVFEFGFLALAALWAFYMGVVLFFYFGDAFSADRRNNAMFFWKSMPVSDLKVLLSKFFSGTLLLPAVIFVITLISGLVFIGILYVVTAIVPQFSRPNAMGLLGSYGNIAVFVLLYTILSLLWFAPFLAWVGGLSAVFGRWSYALAFLVPGLFGVVENIVVYGRGPRGGYVLNYLGNRLHFGLTEQDFAIFATPLPFDLMAVTQRLMTRVDWLQMGMGMVFAGLMLYAASEYRRRRIT